ncbi:MAG: hypothetical protein H8D56_19445 [Planctomycetes bacterium]|nr:hypothetical protein [Planctomycetota bacterium]MBL7142712.1 hypothetical protein [Phycisphaerae bacterium]
MGKYLILDKSVFEATSTSKLENFANNHFLILSDDLYYECATTTSNKEKMLDRFRSVILSGAYFCTSCKEIVKKEAQILQPYGFLVDLKEVPALRKTFQKNSRPYNPDQAQKKLEEELDMAQRIINNADGFTQQLLRDDPELLKEARMCDNSNSIRLERLQKWTEFVDTQNMHESAQVWLNDITEQPEKFCLSDKWVTWHFLRLIHILLQERTFLRQSGDNSSAYIIEHDLQDIKYILLLSRTDGLLTKDKGCSSLAKAAFPDKDVFSSLDEVPNEYLCNWD